MDFFEIVLTIISTFIWAYVGIYLQTKWKNLATKEDVWKITDIVEGIKSQQDLLKKTQEKKFSLKYDACMDALELIDSYYLSEQEEFINSSMQEKWLDEKVVVLSHLELWERARACHNKLVISCDRKETISEFRKCTWCEWSQTLDRIVDFRKAIRLELSFWEESIDDNREGAWIMSL